MMKHIEALYRKAEVRAILKEFAKKYYSLSRAGAYDFPTEDEWSKDEVRQFELNYPELFGYVWSEESEDWVKEEPGRMIRMSANSVKLAGNGK